MHGFLVFYSNKVNFTDTNTTKDLKKGETHYPSMNIIVENFYPVLTRQNYDYWCT